MNDVFSSSYSSVSSRILVETADTADLYNELTLLNDNVANQNSILITLFAFIVIFCIFAVLYKAYKSISI